MKASADLPTESLPHPASRSAGELGLTLADLNAACVWDIDFNELKEPARVTPIHIHGKPYVTPLANHHRRRPQGNRRLRTDPPGRIPPALQAIRLLELPDLAGGVGDQAADAEFAAPIVHPAGQEARLDDDDAGSSLAIMCCSSSRVVSKVVKLISPVAWSWTQATDLYLPRSMARMVDVDAVFAIVFIVQAPWGEGNGVVW